MQHADADADAHRFQLQWLTVPANPNKPAVKFQIGKIPSYLIRVASSRVRRLFTEKNSNDNGKISTSNPVSFDNAWVLGDIK